MTDKEIIIDDVDVSGCEKQGETIAGITCGNGERIRLANEIITKHRLCKDNPNCIYKKYKRKEQECEELKERLESFQKDYSKLYQVVENKGYIKELDQLKAENYLYKNAHKTEQDRRRSYENALTEIKEIAEDNFYYLDSEKRWVLAKIIQKCEEVNNAY